MASSTGKTYQERAAEAAELAIQTTDPDIRKACIDLAEGWTRLERQHQALVCSGFAPQDGEDAIAVEPAAPE